MGEMLNSPLASQPQDVALTIWKVVKHSQAEVVVGSGALAANLYRFAPGLCAWPLQRAIGQ